MRSKHTTETYLRNFIFGVEDGLVSTVGLLSGVAAAGVPRATIVLTGVVLIIVEGLSMGVGSVLTESSAEEYMERKLSVSRTIGAGAIMFLSYIIAGLIPLSPYLFFLGTDALFTSVFASLVALFALGFISAKRFRAPGLRSGMRMLILGGLAIIVGVVVGELLK